MSTYEYWSALFGIAKTGYQANGHTWYDKLLLLLLAAGQFLLVRKALVVLMHVSFTTATNGIEACLATVLPKIFGW